MEEPGRRMSFNEWLSSVGKAREDATDLDEIQWLRQERHALLREPRDWIPVSERLPKDFDVVVVWTSSRVAAAMFRSSQYHPLDLGAPRPRWHMAVYDPFPYGINLPVVYGVTHWMPLPAPSQP